MGISRTLLPLQSNIQPRYLRSTLVSLHFAAPSTQVSHMWRAPFLSRIASRGWSFLIYLLFPILQTPKPPYPTRILRFLIKTVPYRLLNYCYLQRYKTKTVAELYHTYKQTDLDWRYVTIPVQYFSCTSRLRLQSCIQFAPFNPTIPFWVKLY